MNDSKKITLTNEVLLSEVTELLSEGHTVILMTKGSSMHPFIVGERDSVELKREPSLSVGQIALARVVPGRYVLHRVIAVEGENVTLKGDGNLRGVERCTAADVCGVASAIIRHNGRRISCGTAKFKRRSRFWASLPYVLRRCVLGVMRRLPVSLKACCSAIFL